MKIGIDFGTCFSSVAYMNGTEVKGDLLDQEHGKGIPTLFMYSKKRGEVYGYACRGAQNDSDVIRYIKTIIRENPNDLDKSIQSGGKNYKIRDIVKKYLTFLLNLAENKTVEYGLNDTKIESVTITAPVGIDNGKMAATDYNELMKETVMEITGLDCDHVYVLEEPVAAAISYLYGRNVDMKYGKNQAVLVFDLGGGTLDVSVVEHDQASDEYSIKVKEGDLTLGGNAWDEAFEKYILNKLGLDHTALSSLDKIPFREEVTSTKEKLSGTEVARFIGEVDNDLKLTKVTRQEFDQCTKHLLDRAMGVVKKALSSYGYDVDKFVLVGGSSYMPQIKERIKSEFHLDDSEICLHEPANAISRGAAVYTYMKEYGTRIINTASHTYGFDSRIGEDGKDISCAADASKAPSRSHSNVKIINDEPPRKSEKQEQEIQKPLDHDDDSLHSDELSRSAERKKIFVIALFGIVGLISIFWWEIWQWLLGAFAGIAMVVWTVCRYRNSGKYGLQAGIIVGISVVNAFLAWLLPTEWSSMACPISLGAAIALFISSCYADDDSEMGTIIVVMAGLDIVVATSVVGGLSSMLIWGMCYLVPALLLLLVITCLYEKMGGRNGKVISSVVAISAIAFHVVLACISPHFLHSFHGYPKLIDTEIGPKRAICYCGEMIELSVEAGTLVHSYTCDYYDSWDLQGGGTYKFDEEGHWLECRCGASFGVKSEHELKNGVCKACGYEEAYLK